MVVDILRSLSAYVVDSPKVVRTALRRRRRALLLAGLWAAASYLFWMRFSLVMLAIDAVVLYAVRRWELRILSGHSVRLPSRLSAALIAERYEGLRVQLAQSVLFFLLLLATVCMFPWGNFLVIFPPEKVVGLMVGLTVSIAHFILLGYLRILQARIDSDGLTLTRSC